MPERKVIAISLKTLEDILASHFYALSVLDDNKEITSSDFVIENDLLECIFIIEIKEKNDEVNIYTDNSSATDLPALLSGRST